MLVFVSAVVFLHWMLTRDLARARGKFLFGGFLLLFVHIICQDVGQINVAVLVVHLGSYLWVFFLFTF